MKKEFEDTIIIDYTDVLPGDDAPDPLAPEDLEKQAKAAARDAPLSLEPTPPPPAPPAPPVLQSAPPKAAPPLLVTRPPPPPAPRIPPAAPAPRAAPPPPKAMPAPPPPPKAMPPAPPPPKAMPAPPPPPKPAPAQAAPPPPKATPAPPPPKPAPAQAAAAAPPAPRPTSANVIVLSADPALIDLLRDSLAGTHRVWRADDVAHAADLMVAAGNAVFMVDASLADHDTRDLVNQVHKQFPDLAIIVAGRRDDEAQLAPLVSSGVIFRFLHKPASAERIRNFVDATQRRANSATDLPAAAGRTASSTAITGTYQTIEHPKLELPKLELPKLKLDPAVVRRWSRRSLLLIPLMLAVWGIAEWKPWQKVPDLLAKEEAAPASTGEATPDARVQKLLDLAGVALSQGRLVEPLGDNALELYRTVLTHDPGNRVAQRGIDSVADELLVQAERALMEQDLTRLAGAVDAARSARPDHPRLEFFRLQLERELARQGPAPKVPGSAAAAGREADAVAPETTERVQGLVQLANDRMRANRLAGGKDSAHAYLLSARKLDPADAGLQQSALALSALLQKNAALAIKENRLDEADNWATQAAALEVNPQEIAALRADIEAARVGNVRTERAKLLVLANQRIAQGRLIEPAGDSARHYIDLLRAADPAFDGLPDTTALFATRALTDARALAAAGNPDRAETLLRAATDSGAPASEISAISGEIAAAREARQAAARRAQVLPETALKRTKVVAPTYPQRALEKGTEGWVDIEFTVAADGTVRDAVVKASEPAGTFDRAALSAVERWRYEPYLVNGAATEPRVSARVRFQIKE
ncbi:MAG TPA: energy transducer TonB [Steroidobacteraceae bacterium]|nr:energy transducer TonB [Steroidobacteraceae bacterium]